MKNPATQNDAGRLPRPRLRWLRWLLRQLEHGLALIGIASVLYFTGFRYSRIASNSMKPTLIGTNLENGDRVLTERFSYYARNPQRWEVVTIIRKQDGLQVMKRVVGLPGERLQILHGSRVMINGKEVKPPPELSFLKYIPVANVHDGKIFDCGDGYYVLGDHALDSDDSRFNGTVSREEIIGRAWLILGPEPRRGFVNP